MSNPFAPPVAAGSVAPGEAWREGELVVARTGSTLPRACVKCASEDVDGEPLKVVVLWHPRWVYWLVLLGVWPFLIAQLLTRRTGHVHASVCAEHRRFHRIARAFVVVAGVGMFAALVGGWWTDSLGWVGVGFLGLVPVVVGARAMRLLWPQLIEADGVLHLKGAHPDFVAALPDRAQ